MKQRVVTFMISAVLVAAGGEARALDSSLGVGLGYVKPKLLDATLWFTGDFRFQVFKGVFLAPEFGYWKKSTSVAQVTVSSEDLQFGIDAILVLRTGGTVELFAGGGGGMHHLTGDLAARGITAVSNSATQPGLNVQGGIDIRAGDQLSFFVAARYDWVLHLEATDPHLLNQSKFFGGFRLRF